MKTTPTIHKTATVVDFRYNKHTHLHVDDVAQPVQIHNTPLLPVVGEVVQVQVALDLLVPGRRDVRTNWMYIDVWRKTSEL